MENTLSEKQMEDLKNSMLQLSAIVSKELTYSVNFRVDEGKSYNKKQIVHITSDPLSLDSIGILAFAITEITIESFQNVVWDTGTIMFTPHFSYSHRGGGANGCNLVSMNGKQYHYEFKNEKWEKRTDYQW